VTVNFFIKVVDAVLAFDSSGEDRAEKLTLRQDGADHMATRIP
jgi:hypothetical protein